MKRACVILVVAIGACAGERSGGEPTVQQRSALSFAVGDVAGQIIWNGSPVDPAATGDFLDLEVLEAGAQRFSVSTSSFSARGLPVGAHTLVLAHSSSTAPCRPLLGETSFTIVAAATTTADFDLTGTAGRLTGTVTIDGVASSAARFLEDECGFMFRPDAAGTFSVLLAAGTHRLLLSGSDGYLGSFDVVVAAGTTTDAGILDGRTAAAGTATGTVTWNGAPAMPDGSELTVDAVSTTGGPGWTARLRDDGQYSEPGLAPGHYLLTVHSAVNRGPALATGEVTISAGATSTTDFDISATAGRLLLAVTLDGAPAEAALSFHDSGYASFRDDGEFAVFAPAGSLIARARIVGTETETTLDLSVTAGSTTDAGTIALLSWDPATGSGGAVAGTVSWNGAPPPRSDLHLVSARSATGQHWEAKLDTDGRYTFANAAPGSYTASVGLASEGDDGILRMFGAPLATSSVVVSEGGTATLDFNLSANAGHVVGSFSVNGAPASGGAIRLTEFFFDVALIAGPDGRISQLLPAGAYTLDVRPVVAGEFGNELGIFSIGTLSFTVAAGQTTFLDGAQTCADAAECASGFCVDGMCCDGACGGSDASDCQACSIDAGGTANGTCTPRMAGTACADDGNVCTADHCDGTNIVCQHPAGNAGTLCHDAPAAALCEADQICTGTTPVCPPATLPPDVCSATNDDPGACDGEPACVELRGGTQTEGGIELTFLEPYEGEVRVEAAGDGCPPPTGFEIVNMGMGSQHGSGTFIDITASPPVGTLDMKICFHYPQGIVPEDEEPGLQILHGTTPGCPAPGDWEQLPPAEPPTQPDTVNNVICAFATSLSPFALALPVDANGPVFDPVPRTIIAYATSTAGATVSYALPTAVDAVGGPVPVGCAPASGATFAPGKTTVTCEASDTTGHTTAATFTVWVQYQAPADGSFFLKPPRPNGSSIFRIGRPVPVKFQLTGASRHITDLQARLIVTKISGAIQGTVDDDCDEDDDDTDFLFKFRKGKGIYVYRWKTRGEAQGTYRLRADLGDEVAHEIVVSLKAPKR
jgi:hypothetical protein